MEEKEIKSLLKEEEKLTIFLKELEDFEKSYLEFYGYLPFDDFIETIEDKKQEIKARLYDIDKELE